MILVLDLSLGIIRAVFMSPLYHFEYRDPKMLGAHPIANFKVVFTIFIGFINENKDSSFLILSKKINK